MAFWLSAKRAKARKIRPKARTPPAAELACRGAVESALDSNPGVNSAFAEGLVLVRV